VKPQRVRPVQPPPQPQQRQVETRVAPQPVQREVQPMLETVRPQQQIQPQQEVVQVQPKKIEPREIQQPDPLMQAMTPAEVKREVTPAIEQMVLESTPVAAQTYEAQPVVSGPPVVETKSEPIVTASTPVTHDIPVSEPASAPPAPAPAMEAAAAANEPPPTSTPSDSTEPVPPPTPPVAAAQPDPATMEEHQVVASAAISKTAKADNTWVADSLHRRISELRHYPSMARLNGWEGKVVLKVSIRKDGQLKDVQVVTSSGHASLDQAAIEAVKRACPLHMKHELTAPMVVLHLPVNYRLNR
jgi:protein TonB